MDGDICWYCDGTGDRDFLSGAPCHECNGTGWREVPELEDMTDEEYDEWCDEMDLFYSDESGEPHKGQS